MVNLMLCEFHLNRLGNSHIYILCGNKEIHTCQIKQSKNSEVFASRTEEWGFVERLDSVIVFLF